MKPLFDILGAAWRRFNEDKCWDSSIIISYFALLCIIPLAALFAFITSKVLGNPELAFRSLNIFSEDFFAKLDPSIFKKLEFVTKNAARLGLFGLIGSLVAGSFLFSVATLGVTVGGICGGLLCGFLSDRAFQSRRPPVAFLFYLCQVASLVVLGRAGAPGLAAFMIGFTCIWIFGVHGMLTGTASMDFGGTKAASTVAGMLDGVQYLASGLTGFLLGHFLDTLGWGVWTWMLIPFSVIGALLMTRLWNESPLKAKAAH